MTSVLFTGYAHAHFACFRPVFEALRAAPGVDVRVSGGLRSKVGDSVAYDTRAMYAPFGVPEDAVLSMDELAELECDVLFCANTKAIRPRSHDVAVQIFHGLSFRNRAVRSANDGYNRYFVIGPYMQRRLEEQGVLAAGDARALPIGFPKTDRLLDGTLDRAEILAGHGIAGDRPVLLYAPTGARQNSLETMGEELLGRLAAEDRYDVIVKPHDHPKNPIDWFARLAPLEGEHLRVVRDPDVIPLLFAADLLLSDASSVANEYALLDRPIVFLDVPELLAAAAAEDDRLDLGTWGRRGGIVAPDADAAVSAVAEALADPSIGSDVRRAMTADLFYNPGRATDAALDWLLREMALA